MSNSDARSFASADPVRTHTMKPCIQLLLLALVLTQGNFVATAALYKPGDVSTDFTLVARRPFTRPDGTLVPVGGTVHLSDFADRIVFLEWFAVWCPYCVAAAPQIETGIVKYYGSRGGNPQGVPVLHVAVNQEAAGSYQTRTDDFVTKQGFAITVNDYDSKSVNKVRFMFQSSGQPIFAVINGVTNSTSHKPWEILVNQLGYGQLDFSQSILAFRKVIDTVQAGPPPPLTLNTPHLIGTDFQFTLNTTPGRSYRVQGSGNLSDWLTLTSIPGSLIPFTFRDTNPPPNLRFYRVVSP